MQEFDVALINSPQMKHIQMSINSKTDEIECGVVMQWGITSREDK